MFSFIFVKFSLPVHSVRVGVVSHKKAKKQEAFSNLVSMPGAHRQLVNNIIFNQYDGCAAEI